MTIKRIVVVSDLQVPYHDEIAVRNVASFIKAYRPDSVLTLGDEIDLPQISRWTEGTAGWYEQTLADDRDQAVEVLWSLTEHAKEAHMIRSNHFKTVTIIKYLCLFRMEFDSKIGHLQPLQSQHQCPRPAHGGIAPHRGARGLIHRKSQWLSTLACA